jgi:3-oxoacyl-(acyl-carrier-protein) synthase
MLIYKSTHGCFTIQSHHCYILKVKNNMIDYYLGPSYAVDTACSSSLLALDQALQSVRSGQCDAAIVGGCSLCLKPSTSMQFNKLGNNYSLYKSIFILLIL